jgi:hypothetical protein
MITTNDLHYCQFDKAMRGFITFRVHAIRPIHPVNFSPMTEKYILASNYTDCYVQVLVYLGKDWGFDWITVMPHQLKNCREVIK